MRKLKVCCGVVLLGLLHLVLVPSLSYAQEEKNQPNTKPQLTPYEKKVLEYSLLEYEMLQVRKARELSDPVRSQLLFTLEQLVETTCMPALTTTLSYEGPGAEKQCLKYLEELEALQKDNPVLLCARHGIDSDSCKDAYDKQYVTTYFKPPHKSLMKDSSDFWIRMQTPKKEEIDKLPYLATVEDKFQELPSNKNRSELNKNLSLRIRAECSPVNRRLTFEEPDEDWKISYRKITKSDDPLAELVDLYENSRNSDSKSKKDRKLKSALEIRTEDYAGLKTDDSKEEKPLKPAWRLRLLPDACPRIIERALAFDSQFPEAHCYKEGFKSPRCIQAIRFQKDRHEALKRAHEKRVTKPKKQPAFTTW